MLGDAINAFVARDSALARSVVARDDLADGSSFTSWTPSFRAWRDRPDRESSVAVVFAAKEFERIADLCTNLAEDVVFVAEGTNIRHEGQM